MAGRKSAYELKIKSRFADIEKWLKGGATERQVAQALGVAYSTFNKYKASEEEFAELLKSIDRSEIVLDLRSALLKKAMGYTYTEKKTYKKRDDSTGSVSTYTEITEKVAHPDVAAINLALKNYDRDNWSNDWQQYDIKREELELKKKLAEADNWEGVMNE